MISKVRGVGYSFYCKDKRLDSKVAQILTLNPDVFFLNICWYKDIFENLSYLRKRLPKTTFIIRVHHDVGYLEKQEKFLDVVKLCDHAVVSTKSQKLRLVELGYLNGISILPFGVNSSEFVSNVDPNARDIDLISFTNAHPARNQELINKVYPRLIGKGFVVENVTGLSREELSAKLARAKFMLLSSLTEASGSRILLEAISAGCSPIVFKECETAVEVLKDHSCGHIMETGLLLKVPQKKVVRPFLVKKNVEKKLIKILNSSPNPSNSGLKNTYEFENEVENIYKIIKAFGE